MPLLAESSSGPVIETVSGGGGPTVTVGSPTPVTPLTGTIVTTAPVPAPQPAGASPLTTGPTVQTAGTSKTPALSSMRSAATSPARIVQRRDLIVGGPDCSRRRSGRHRRTRMELDANPVVRINSRPDHHSKRLDHQYRGLNFYYPSLSVDTSGRRRDRLFGFEPHAANLELRRLRDDDGGPRDHVHQPDPAQAGNGYLRRFLRSQPERRLAPRSTSPLGANTFNSRPARRLGHDHGSARFASRLRRLTSSTWASPARPWPTATTASHRHQRRRQRSGSADRALDSRRTNERLDYSDRSR